MRLRVIVPGPEIRGFKLGAAVPPGDASPRTSREIPKTLINSDEHLEWQVYHAQPRFGLRRISRTDHGQPCSAVLEPAGICVRLARQTIFP